MSDLVLLAKIQRIPLRLAGVSANSGFQLFGKNARHGIFAHELTCVQ